MQQRPAGLPRPVRVALVVASGGWPGGVTKWVRTADIEGVKLRLRTLALLAVVATLGVGCASTGARPRPFPTPGDRGATAPPAAHAPASPHVVQTALALVGTPYRAGGASPSGFDCSGYVVYVYGTAGVSLPRTVTDLYRATGPIASAAVRPGDLVFFDINARGPSHVGLALGDGTFVHAPSGRGVVRVERLDAPYWRGRFLGARRVASGPTDTP